MITDEQFDALVSASDALARTEPAKYLRKMRGLLLLGDLYLAALTMVLLGLQIGALVLIIRELYSTGAPGWQTLLALPVLLWALWFLRKLFLMPSGRKASTGIPLRKTEAPELFALIETFSAQADTLPVHRVLLTDEFHASLEQFPRLGVFGWHENTLLLGLPLFQCLTSEQFKALLAHELGHMSRKGHCKLGRQGHRQMLRWTGLAQALDDDPHVWLFKHFLEWFIDYTGACAFPLIRMGEYEADTQSVRLVSLQAAVETLSVSNVIDRYLQEHYWPQVRRLANELPEPVAPYRLLGETFAGQVNTAWAEHWLAVDLTAKVGLTSTHPSLYERFNALQATPRIVLAKPGQTAEGLLGNALQVVTEQMDRTWQDGIRAWWVEQYESVQKNRRQFAELNARVASGAELTVEEAYERARLTWSVGRNRDETLKQLLALYFRDKESPLASFGLGAWLLESNDDEGKYTAEDGYDLLEQAMRLDAGFTVRCCELLRDYCRENGREEKAQDWEEKLQAALQLEG